MVVGDGGVRKLVSKSESVCRPIALVSLIFVSRNCERVCLCLFLIVSCLCRLPVSFCGRLGVILAVYII